MPRLYYVPCLGSKNASVSALTTQLMPGSVVKIHVRCLSDPLQAETQEYENVYSVH